MDYLIGIVVVAVMGYLIAVSEERVDSPLTTYRRLRHRHENPRSDTGDTPETTDVPDVVSECPPEPGDAPNFVRISPGNMTAWLAASNAAAPEEEPEPDPVTARRAWVAARLDPTDRARLTPGEIDTIGAEKFGCSEKTIERDRRHLRRGGAR